MGLTVYSGVPDSHLRSSSAIASSVYSVVFEGIGWSPDSVQRRSTLRKLQYNGNDNDYSGAERNINENNNNHKQQNKGGGKSKREERNFLRLWSFSHLGIATFFCTSTIHIHGLSTGFFFYFEAHTAKTRTDFLLRIYIVPNALHNIGLLLMRFTELKLLWYTICRLPLQTRREDGLTNMNNAWRDKRCRIRATRTSLTASAPPAPRKFPKSINPFSSIQQWQLKTMQIQFQSVVIGQPIVDTANDNYK